MNILQPSKHQNAAEDDVLPSSQKPPEESAIRGSGENVDRGSDENLPPAAASAAAAFAVDNDSDDDDIFSGLTLKRGQMLPSVSTVSNLSYDIAAKEGEEFKVFVTLADTPLVLRDLDAAEWKKNTFLKETFKKPSARSSKPGAKESLVMTQLVFPQCLLLGAKTLNDRLIVINWWLNQTLEQQQEHSKNFKVLFSRPTKSASPLPLRLSAKGAAMAEARGIAPKIISILDDRHLKEAYVATTASYATVNGARSSAWRKGAPTTNSQMYDRKARRKIEGLMKYTSKIMSEVCPSAQAKNLRASVHIMLQVKIRAPVKSRHGGYAAYGAQMMDQHIVLGESQESIATVLGSREQAQALQQAAATNVWYRNEQNPLPLLKRGRHSSICPAPSAVEATGTTTVTTATTATMEEDDDDDDDDDDDNDADDDDDDDDNDDDDEGDDDEGDDKGDDNNDKDDYNYNSRKWNL